MQLALLPNAFLMGNAAAGGIAPSNSIGSLRGFADAYLVGRVADSTGNPAATVETR